MKAMRHHRPLRFTLAALAAFAVCGGALASARSAQPATQPVRLTTAELREKALNAFDAGDYATALPLLKDLSVRERNNPEVVAPLLEKIRVCEANVAQTTAPREGFDAPRVPHAKPQDGSVYELELQKLGNFTYDADKGGDIPDDVKALAGSTVKLTGFMIPIEETDKITKFVLVPDLFACCFGQPPELQHTAIVVCPPGKAVSYFPDKISVQGKLVVDEKREDGFVIAIFEVSASSIRPVIQ